MSTYSLDDLKAQFCQSSPFCQSIGMVLSHVDAQRAEIHFAMHDRLIGNPLAKILHGGVIASVLDSVGGALALVAAINNLTPGFSEDELKDRMAKTSTVGLTINYVRPGRGTSFVATAKTTRSGRRIHHAEMQLENEEKTCIATASGIYIIT